MSNRRQWIVEWFSPGTGKWSNVHKWDYEAMDKGWSFRKAMRLAAGMKTTNKNVCAYRLRSLITNQIIILM